jgi:hypothetical protein
MEHRRGCIVQSAMSRTVGHRMTSCGIAQSIAKHGRAGQTNAWHHMASCRVITSHRRTPCGTVGVARHHRPSRGIVGHRIMGHIQTNTHTHKHAEIHRDPLRSTYTGSAPWTHTGRLSTPSMREILIPLSIPLCWLRMANTCNSHSLL